MVYYEHDGRHPKRLRIYIVQTTNEKEIKKYVVLAKDYNDAIHKLNAKHPKTKADKSMAVYLPMAKDVCIVHSETLTPHPP